MDGRPTWTDCDEAGDYVVPNVLSPRDLVFRPDNMDKTVPHTHNRSNNSKNIQSRVMVTVLYNCMKFRLNSFNGCQLTERT